MHTLSCNVVYIMFWDICILQCIIFTVAISDEVNIAGLFEHNEKHERAFKYAVNSINEKANADDFTLVPLVENDLLEDRPFAALKATCNLLNIGLVGIFGPRSFDNIDTIQSICDAKEIPHIITRWNNWPIRDGTIVNFYPHPPLLSKAYYEIIQAWGWQTFTILYEDDESLVRMMSIIETAKDDGMVVQILQLDPSHTGNYRITFKQLKRSDQRFFVLDCYIEHLLEVMLQLQQVGLMNENYNYFITNLDTHTEDLTPFKYSGANITGIRIVNPDKPYVQDVSAQLYSDDELSLPESLAWNLRTETALIIDALHMFSNALNERRKESSLRIFDNNNVNLSCDYTNSWEHGFSVINILKTNSYEGLTGLVKFNTEGFRSDFDINIFVLKEGGVTDIGNWNSSTGLNLTAWHISELVADEESLRNKSFNVLITLTEPYGMLKVTTERLYGNDRFEGFGTDLIQRLSEMEGFNYTFIVREDKKNGAFDPDTGKWTGMIGDLLEHRADLAITDFTITSDREEAVDFTVPFMSLGISILFRKPENAPPSFFSFADPFALDTWIALAVSFFVVSLSFYVIGRICADEWTNPYPCIEEPEYLINQFSFFNCIWFTTGSLMAQGSEIAPIAMSTRMVAGMWWFFCLIIVASYTANLAAFLATENPVVLFNDLKGLYENKHGIEYGAKEGGATLGFFTRAEEGTLFKKIGQHMKDFPANVKENDEGVVRAEKEKYAFFMESTSIEYAIQRHCNLKQYGGLLDEKGYGIAMRKNSPYRKRLSLAILKLQSSQVIDELKRKWWEERRGGGQCANNVESAEADPLNLVNVEGCFFVTIYGTIFSLVLVIIEYLLFILRTSKRCKLPFKVVFKKELDSFLDFHSNNKEVLKKEGSKSSSSEEKSANQYSKIESKLGSEENKSKADPKNKSKSSLESKSKSPGQSLRSRSNGKLSYGFIIPSSVEGLNEQI